MSQIPSHFQLDFRPIAAPEATIVSGSARFTVLTPRLIRLEYDENGRFQDQPSQVFWYREQPAPDFSRRRDNGRLAIGTDYLTLRYQVGRPFTSETLNITLKEQNHTWRYGDEDEENLRGTTRTLDQVSGSTRLEPGLLSRAGWTLVNDSDTLVFNSEGWLEPRQRSSEKTADLYFFGYGHDYAACLQDYARVAGSVPLLPRWALGNWWSRYWEYTQDELTALMDDFRAHEVPLAVCIVDMDWHLSGWTGYTWNRELFPDPPQFIDWLHRQGLKTALNLHPAAGVGPHEAMYEEMARRLDVDPETEKPVSFDIADPDFTRAYFELLHHPHEAEGIDFWWIDWQQGEESSLPGLDPLWWLNHLHFYDLGRGDKRPFIFSRWGGLGNHRYPIGFSGDTYVDWASLAFQPYFTATAANVNFGWWSHDIGGHQRGFEDGELYTRWVQFGVFSPIFRLHSTKNRFHERRPWGYDVDVFQITQKAMQLRHALIPYLYTQSWRNWQTHLPPFRPLYHDYPETEAAYHCPQQYTVGSELIAAPYTSPADPNTRLSRQVVWLPPGEWYHFFSGQYFPGDTWQVQYGRLDDIPVFARAGAIVPLGPTVGWGGVDNPELLDVHVFAGADNSFTLYEDDGETQAYQDGKFALTTITQSWREQEMTVTIAAVEGDASLRPEPRRYRPHLHGIVNPKALTVQIDGETAECNAQYDAHTETLHLDAISLPATAVLTVTVNNGNNNLLARRDRTEETIIDMLHTFQLETSVKAAIADVAASLADHPRLLADYALHLTPSQTRALLEVTQEAGVHHVQNQGQPHLLVLWNNQEKLGMCYRMTRFDREQYLSSFRFGSDADVVPRSKFITPEKEWGLTADYFGQTVLEITHGLHP